MEAAEDETGQPQLAAGLDAWRAAAQAPAGPVRTCFRLVEPPGRDGADGERTPADEQDTAGSPWRVEFALQSTEDPSLMLAAEDIWAGTGGWAPGGIQHPDEELLAGLGARRPAVQRAGHRAAHPRAGPGRAGHRGRVPLPEGDRPAAGRGRLRRAAAGLGPQGPARPEAHRPVPGGASTGADGAASGAAFGLDDLVQFRYDLAVGDDTLDPAELAELARLKIPLVRLRGQWVELDERNLQAALRFLERDRR